MLIPPHLRFIDEPRGLRHRDPPGIGRFWPCACCGANGCLCPDPEYDYLNVTLTGFGNVGCTNCTQINVVITLKRITACVWVQCSPPQDFGCFNSLTGQQDPILVAACSLTMEESPSDNYDVSLANFFLDGFFVNYSPSNCTGLMTLVDPPSYGDAACSVPETLQLSVGDEYGCGAEVGGGCCPGVTLPDSLTLTMTVDSGCTSVFPTTQTVTMTGSGAERIWSVVLPGTCTDQAGKPVEIEFTFGCASANLESCWWEWWALCPALFPFAVFAFCNGPDGTGIDCEYLSLTFTANVIYQCTECGTLPLGNGVITFMVTA